MSKLNKLLNISSQSIGPELPATLVPTTREYGPLGVELSQLLRFKNGLYAFESALHVFPSQLSESGWSLEEWNDRALWRFEYRGLADGMLFFAEDAFGNQFCIRQDRICFFDSETGECRELADSLEAWAELIFEDYDFQTGYPLLHEWQSKNGRLSASQRLVPKFPFVLGGEYKLENLVAMDSMRVMQARGNIAWQLQDVPEGAEVEICLENYPPNA